MSSFSQVAASLLRKLRISPYARSSFQFSRKPTNHFLGRCKIFVENGGADYGRSSLHKEIFQWILLSGPAAIILGMSGTPALADDGNGPGITELRKVEDGSIVSNDHTKKWRIFTDGARNFFFQGKHEPAERMFVSAIEEAQKGFGKRDPHVASACNNLAEFYRVSKKFDKAEPLYLKAINILEESYGPDDIRVGAALHNLGQVYLVQRKLEKAHAYYERALKIKRRVLGEASPDYSDTMYHLGRVLFLEGKEKDGEALLRDSIQILEENGQGQSPTCLGRLQYLAQIYIKSNRSSEAELLQRKVLQLVEISKGWTSTDTVIAAERLALTLQSVGNLKEAEELLERCLAARRTLLPEDDIETAANMVYIARVKMVKFSQLRKENVLEAMKELEGAKLLVTKSLRATRKALVEFGDQKSRGVPNTGAYDSTMLVLLQSLNALALLETIKLGPQESMDQEHSVFEAEKVLRQCISTFKEFGSKTSASRCVEVKTEYLSCLRHLLALMDDNDKSTVGVNQTRKAELEALKDAVKRVEGEVSAARQSRS